MSKLVNIQIMRAVAALAVVLYHVATEIGHMCEAAGRQCADGGWFGLGGVMLFFMISGFIMVVTSWNAFQKPAAPLDFLRRRVERIVPLYWLITTAAVAAVVLFPAAMQNVQGLDPYYVAASYFFYPMARANGTVYPIAILGWTLELEMMFYIIFAAAMYFNRKLGMALAIATLVIFTTAKIAGLFGASVPLNFWADPIILDFVLGMLVGASYMGGAKLPQSAAWVLGLAAVVLTLAVTYFPALSETYPITSLATRLVLAAPAAALFLLGAIGPQLRADRPLTRLGLLLGDASYSLYLIHPFMLRPLAKLWEKLFGAQHLWAFAILGPVVAIAAGLALYWLVEKPLTRYFGKKRITPLAAKPAFATSAGSQ